MCWKALILKENKRQIPVVELSVYDHSSRDWRDLSTQSKEGILVCCSRGLLVKWAMLPTLWGFGDCLFTLTSR